MKFVTLTAPLNVTGEEVPSEFTLLKAGVNSYVDGELIFDAESAGKVMARYQSRRIDLMADYEHQSLQVPPVRAPASAKKWVPELRNGDLVAADIKWTTEARKHIAEGEYRYFSIACRVDPKTSQVVEVINFALTNNPAANAIAPLVAASLNFAGDSVENSMKTVTVALGLRPDAEEADALAAVTSMKDFERNVVALTGKASKGEALGVLTALVAKADRADKAEAELVALKAAQDKADTERVLDAGISGGKLLPTMELVTNKATKGSALKMLSIAGLEGLKTYIETCPVIAKTASESPREQSDLTTKASDLSEMDLEIARQITGDDPVALKKHCDNIREYRARPDKLRRSAVG